MKYTFILLLFSSSIFAQNAESLVHKMTEAIGGHTNFYNLNDIEYQYTYRSKGKSNVSVERYILDGEISYGKYIKNELKTAPNSTSPFIQYFDGSKAYVFVDGKLSDDKAAVDKAFFSRKTNLYWLFMMQKLEDPGLNYSYDGKRLIEGIDYDIVTVTFNQGVGVAQDRYVLYINPYTHLVDQFLFTIDAVGVKDPYLMKVQYQSFDGVMLPVLRKYKKAINWEGDYDTQSEWVLEICENLKFNNGFTQKNILK